MRTVKEGHTYIVEIFLVALSQALVQSEFAQVDPRMRLRAITDEELVLNTIIQIARFLEDLDVDFQEERKPTGLIIKKISGLFLPSRKSLIPLVPFRTARFARGKMVDSEVDSWG